MTRPEAATRSWRILHPVRYGLQVIHERYTDRHMPKLLNLNGAAEVLGVSPQYVHRLAERGELVGAKIGSSWVFRRVTVERFDRQRKGGPPAEA
jgi:excisionase family DNA binding protein